MQHRRLLRWLPAAVAPVVVAGAVAVPLVAAATPPSLPAKSAQQVLQLIAKAKDLQGFTGVVEQRSNLGLPSVPGMGPGSGTDTASTLDLLSGTHTARIDVAGATKARIAILDDSAERDIVRNGRTVWVWDSKANSATHLIAPAGGERQAPEGAIPTPAEAAQELLAKVDGTTRVSVDSAQQVADQDAYTLVLTPRSTTTTTIGSVRIAVDAHTGLPLDVQVLAQGGSSPAFETGFTSISYAVPAASRFVFTPPKDAKVTTKTAPTARPEHPAAGASRRPVVHGSGWATVVTTTSAPSTLLSNPTVKRLTTKVRGGRLLHTTLVNVLLTNDGRVLAGAVPASRLESAAR